MTTRMTPRETDFSIWVSDLSADAARPAPVAHEVDEARSASVDAIIRPMRNPHWHEEHEILTIISGAARLMLDDGETFYVAAGQVLVVPGGLSHLLEVDTRVTLRGLYVHPHLCRQMISRESEHEIMVRLADWRTPLTPRVVVDPYLFRSLQEIFEQSQAEFARNDAWRTAGLQAIGRLAAITLARLMQAEDGGNLHADPTVQRVLRVKAWMDRHYLEQVSLPELAHMAHLSSSQFSTLFRQHCGASPKAYLIQQRLRKAASLLADSTLSVTEIASGVGFEHLAHFGRLFREYSGYTPREFRKNHQVDRKNLLE